MQGYLKKIPKQIWFLWFQGYEKAPLVVKKCFESWKSKNPDWKINFLCKDNLNEYIELNLQDDCKLARLGKAHQSDLVRLKLLSKYGGVWIDSTCFCVNPLDNWLEENIDSGFFAFRNPGRDRVMSNWFLAAEKDSIITSNLYQELINYWYNNNLSNQGKTTIIKALNKVLNRNDYATVTTRLWFSPIVTKFLKVYPHFVFHYKFLALVKKNSLCKEIWLNTPEISSESPHKVLHSDMSKPITEEIKQEIDYQTATLYKLNWKRMPKSIAAGSKIDYLFESI